MSKLQLDSASGVLGDQRTSGVESFWRTGRGLVRRVELRAGGYSESVIEESAEGETEHAVDPALAEQVLLRRKSPPPGAQAPSSPLVRLVDLFCGCGGITLGVKEACRALGLELDVRLALDIDETALSVYGRNFNPDATRLGDISDWFDGEVSSPLTKRERVLKDEVGPIDVLVGGPPCQGHSDLNNTTRRNDPKNRLYMRMARAVEVLRPRHVIIENVPGALNDRGRVVQQTMEVLRASGYAVSSGVLDGEKLGVPQSRKRLIVMASLDTNVDVGEVEAVHSQEPRTVEWAIRDLSTEPTGTVPFNTPANSAPATRRRIAYLFEHGLRDLPNSQRPPCHQNGGHTYSSIYGRLSWDSPSQTITTGFYSMCMGRYVHPSLERTLTAHEAARLQYFPDFFDFSTIERRTHLATIIGNAVPMRLGYAVALELLR